MSLGTSGTVFVVSNRAASDPNGVVAGFADAAGRYLPLACTLNCTLAVDRVAGWLGLGRDDVPMETEVVFLPFLDGERTPNLPSATGTATGLRHNTNPGEILLAAYQGAVASLLSALDALDKHSTGVAEHASLVLIGGGAQGQTWRNVVRRLSGRPLRIAHGRELVAIGAAAQAAAALTGEDPVVLARAWGHGGGEEIPATEADEPTLNRIAAVQEAAMSLLT